MATMSDLALGLLLVRARLAEAGDADAAGDPYILVSIGSACP